MEGIVLSESMTPEDLKLVGENCSQYQRRNRSTSATMGPYEDEELSCNTCTHWSGERCVIDAFDNVAVNLGILHEDEEY
jgi:hypothetical protein